MIYEIQMGVFVEADDEFTALDKLDSVMKNLEGIDYEGDPVTEIVSTYTMEQFSNLGRTPKP